MRGKCRYVYGGGKDTGDMLFSATTRGQVKCDTFLMIHDCSISMPSPILPGTYQDYTHTCLMGFFPMCVLSFGSMKQEELIFYARKKECVTAAEMGGGGGVNAGPANVTGERNEAVSVQSLRKDDIMKYVVRAGKYVTVAMHIEGNWVHKQILYAVFFSEPPSVEQRKQFFLQQDHINKGTMVIVRPQLLKWWKSEEGSGTTKKLARDATLKSVDEFLSQDI